MSMDTKPNLPIVARSQGYALYSNGELWKTGRYAYRAGYVNDPDNIDNAIDAHEEELACLAAEL